MAQIRSIPMSIPEILADIGSESDRILTEKLLRLFVDEGCGYLVSATNPKRIYCYVKKSKETLIINKETYVDRLPDGAYSLQIRISSPKTFAALDRYTENVRSQILNGRNCKSPACCNCGKWYVFSYGGETYRKCHMLCDNFSFSHLTEQDAESVLDIVGNEFRPKQAT